MALTEMNYIEGGGGKSEIDTLASCPADRTITVGFEPKYIFFSVKYSTNGLFECIYDADTSTTTCYRRLVYNGSLTEIASHAIGASNSEVGTLEAVTSTGFVLTAASSPATNIHYLAVG